MIHALRRSLFVKLAGPMALTLLLSFGLAAVVAILLGRRFIDRELADGLRFDATMALMQVQHHFGQRIAELELWAGDAVMDDLLIDDREWRIQNHLLRLKRAFPHEYVQLAVLSRNETVVASTDVRGIGQRLNLKPLNLAPIPRSLARRSGIVMVDGVRTVVLTYPVTSRLREDTGGSLVVHLSWQPVEEILLRRPEGPPLHLLDGSGRAIAGHAQGSSSGAGASAQQPGRLVDAVIRGHRFVSMAAAPAASDADVPADWRVVVMRESSNAYWPVRLFIMAVVGAGLLGLLVTAGTAFALARTVSGRLRALRDSTQRIAAGDLSHRAAILGDDELGDLADSFNSMTNELATARNGLEREVAARTQALRDRTAQLEISEARKSAVLGSSLDGIVTFNGEGHVEEINPAAQAIFGIPGSEALGLYITDLVIPPPTVGADESFVRYLRRHDDLLVGQRFETVGRRRATGQFPVEFVVTRISTADRGLYTAFVRDISDQKRAERQLLLAKVAAELSASSKLAFLDNLSREIRMQLTGVASMLELLSSTTLTEEQRRCTSVAKSSADTSFAILNDVLEFSALDAGRLTLDRMAFDVTGHLRQAVDGVAKAAEAKGIGLRVSTDPDIPVFVMGDPARVRQVLSIILAYAVRCASTGEVAVHVRGLDDDLQFEIGSPMTISRDAVTRIFNPFSDVDARGTRRPGTGLALAILKQLVERMGGRVMIKANEGEGATFYITLPLQSHGPLLDQAPPLLVERHVQVGRMSKPDKL